MTSRATTRTGEVFEGLRSEVLNGTLAPGQRIRLVEMAQRFTVSQSVVREALTRLAGQGLVIATPQRGFRVRDLSVEDVLDLTEARIEIEARAVEMAIDRGDLVWESNVLSTFHVLDRTPVKLDDGRYNETWSLRHSEFHGALIDGCGNTRIAAVAENLRASAELYRRWNWALADDHRRNIALEHQQLKDLVLARDTDGAIALLVEHIERAPLQLVAYCQANGMASLDQQPSERLLG